MEEILEQKFLGNAVQNWGIFVLVLLAGLLVLYNIRKFLVRRLKILVAKTNSTIDDFLVEVFERSVVPMLYLLLAFIAFDTLILPVKVSRVIHVAFMFGMLYFAINIISSLIRHFIFSFLGTGEEAEQKKKQARGILILVNIMIWAIGVVFVINNLGYNVTTIITGLGIGGIAIALAAQTVLGDLFSYFIIFFDRPFEIGDFVSVGDKSGNIEKVGIKTTRIKTLSGEQLVCSNTYLTNNPLHNFKKMHERRIVMKFGVTYQTSSEKLRRIPDIVKEIISAQDSVRLDRGHFSGFGDSSLNFEFVYYVLSGDYGLYMDRQQAIGFNILGRFEHEGIEFAYPTQTLFINSPKNGQLEEVNH